ncbi:MAG TPA: OB-fold domain-containing protein [Candidatus Binatia bacterium]|nr:OB-fold domain-containing protein [Candidatus Binatia bacterium]
MSFRREFPLPDLDWAPTREFWAGAARGELLIPRCACGRWVWYPNGTCRFCGAHDARWTRAGGRGRLFSWSVVRRPFIPQLADDVPYVPALVTIDEDSAVRLVTRIVDCEPDALRVDMPVRVVFRPLRFAGVAGEVTAPLFVPA